MHPDTLTVLYVGKYYVCLMSHDEHNIIVPIFQQEKYGTNDAVDKKYERHSNLTSFDIPHLLRHLAYPLFLYVGHIYRLTNL